MHFFRTTKFGPTFLFLIILLLVTSPFYLLIAHTKSLHSGWSCYVVGLMWSPGIAAILSVKLLQRDLSSLGWKWGEQRWLWRSYLVPAIYILITYLIIWTVGWGKFYDVAVMKEFSTDFGFDGLPLTLALFFVVFLIAVFQLPVSASSAVGEEIGWRGFVVPELFPKLGYTKTSLIVGVIWALWHYPVLLFADYNRGTEWWYALSCFTVMVVALSFIFTWFRMRSGSLWTGVILHAAHNVFNQMIMENITQNIQLDVGRTEHYSGEFGIVLPVICVVTAIFFWRKRGALDQQLIGKEPSAAVQTS